MRNTIIAVLTLLTLSPVGCYGQPAREESREETAAQFLELVSKSDFESAGELLHFPAELSPAELIEESENLRVSLKIITEELGDLVSVRTRPPGQYSYHTVGVMAGELEYWKQHPHYTALKFMGRTTKDLDVLINITFLPGDSAIRSVAFGLPVSSENREILLHIFNRLSRESLGVEPPPDIAMPVVQDQS